MHLVSASDITQYIQCPRAAVTRMLTGRWRQPTTAMQFGTWFHALFHHHQWPNLTTPSTPRPPLPPDPTDTKEDLDAARAAITNFTWAPGFKLLGLERPYSCEHESGLRLVGRLDAELLSEPYAYSGQIKTIAKGRSLALELERVRTSPYELVYGHLSANAGRPLSGTVLLTYQKTAQRRSTRITTSSPTGSDSSADRRSTIDQWVLPRTPDESRTLFQAAISPVLAALREDLRLGPGQARPNLTACFGPFGTGPVCPLFAYCHSGEPLDICLEQSLEPVPTTAARYPEFA